MTEGSAGPDPHQAFWKPAPADWLTILRLPLAVAFVLAPAWRLPILIISGISDVLDGIVARARGGTRLGAFLDPLADKVFAAAAFGVVAFSGSLAWYEVLGVLLRDIVAALAFVSTIVRHRTRVIPARAGGKLVTALQMGTLLAFLLESAALRPLAWLTAAVGILSVWDYHRVAGRKAQGLKL
jgi:phosphatidylglycerophosphate synthase